MRFRYNVSDTVLRARIFSNRKLFQGYIRRSASFFGETFSNVSPDFLDTFSYSKAGTTEIGAPPKT